MVVRKLQEGEFHCRLKKGVLLPSEAGVRLPASSYRKKNDKLAWL